MIIIITIKGERERRGIERGYKKKEESKKREEESRCSRGWAKENSGGRCSGSIHAPT